MTAIETSTVPEPTPPAPAPLLVRARVLTTTAITRSFAAVRTGQAIAVHRTQTWLTAVDTALTRSLAAGEQFLLARIAPPDATSGS